MSCGKLLFITFFGSGKNCCKISNFFSTKIKLWKNVENFMMYSKIHIFPEIASVDCGKLPFF